MSARHAPIVLPAYPASGPCTIRFGAGGLDSLLAVLDEHVGAHRYVMVTDRTVARLHGQALRDRLAAAGVRVDILEIEPGEASKTRAVWMRLTDALSDLGLGRDGGLLALGGGVVGDLTGFVAATYMRGIPVVQLPTTLLAMIDASIGGKTGVDTAAGKNLVGAFHPPRAIVADPDVLSTLPDDELRMGLAEAVKHGAIADRDYLGFMRESAAAILARDPAIVEHLVYTSIRIKARTVQADPLERGVRATLNFGHTVGHAIERLTAFGTPHGHAVAIGMVVEARIGERLGCTEPGTAAMLEDLCGRFGLPTALPGDVDAGALADAAASDKKNRANRLRMTLLRRPGEALMTEGSWTRAVDPADLVRAIAG